MAVRCGMFNICTFLERWNQFCINVVIARQRWTEVTNGLFCCIRSFGCLAEKRKTEKKELRFTPLSAWLMGRPRVYFNNASLLLLVVHVIIARSHDGKPRAGANTNTNRVSHMAKGKQSWKWLKFPFVEIRSNNWMGVRMNRTDGLFPTYTHIHKKTKTNHIS